MEVTRMFFNRLKGTPEEQAQQEYTNAQVKQNRADIEYIAIMADVDLGEEEVMEHEPEN